MIKNMVFDMGGVLIVWNPVQMLARLRLPAEDEALLNRELLSALPKDCVLLELASAPGGFDPEDARKLGLRQRNLPGLPGKYAPEAAAEALEKACRQLFSREMEEKTL